MNNFELESVFNGTITVKFFDQFQIPFQNFRLVGVMYKNMQYDITLKPA